MSTAKKKRAKNRSKVNLPPVKLFVYGTLKRGCRLNGWMENSTFIREDELIGYSLLSLGAYPALIRTNNFGRVQGEVWEVPADDFAAVRQMEESVGYSTITERTLGGEQVYAFLFGEVRSANIVTWNDETCTVDVAPNVIPF